MTVSGLDTRKVNMVPTSSRVLQWWNSIDRTR